MKRFVLVTVLLFAVTAPSISLAEGPAPAPAVSQAAPPGPTIGQELVAQFLTTGGLASVFGVLLAGAGALLHLDSRRKAQIAAVTKTAYMGVENYLAIDDHPNETLTKVEKGLQLADQWCLAHGWRLPDEKEKALIKLGFDALHGQASLPVPTSAPASPPAAQPGGDK